MIFFPRPYQQNERGVGVTFSHKTDLKYIKIFFESEMLIDIYNTLKAIIELNIKHSPSKTKEEFALQALRQILSVCDLDP